MKKMMVVMAVVIGLVVSGCAIGRSVNLPAGDVNFSPFKTVSISIEDKVLTEYSKSGTEMLRGILLDKVCTSKPYRFKKFSSEAIRKGLNLKLLEKDAELSISIVIDYFKPDNKALRLLVGFGSGKGGIHYVATFSANGQVIAVLDGGKSYGDALMVGDTDSTVYRGAESTQILMVDYSANEIVEFMREGR
jgi:hypothetical protein